MDINKHIISGPFLSPLNKCHPSANQILHSHIMDNFMAKREKNSINPLDVTAVNKMLVTQGKGVMTLKKCEEINGYMGNDWAYISFSRDPNAVVKTFAYYTCNPEIIRDILLAPDRYTVIDDDQRSWLGELIDSPKLYPNITNITGHTIINKREK
jgi:hypothetical protein